MEKNPEKIEQIFGDYLWNTISIRDTAAAKEKKENFYHGILLGLLGYKATWLTKSNAESGTGYSDILVEVPDNRTGIVIELKYAENGDMELRALRRIVRLWLENNKNLFTNRRRYARFLYKLIVPFVSATGNGGICYTQKRTS